MKRPFSTEINLSRTQNYWFRQDIIKYIFTGLLIGFAIRIVLVHQLDAGDISLQQYGEKQTHTQSTNPAYRGDILDRNNTVLASNLILKKVNLDPTKIQAEFIPELAKTLMIPEAKLRAALAKKLSKKKGRRHLIIKKDIALSDPILNNIRLLKQKKITICRNKNVKSALKKTSHKIPKVCGKENIGGVNLQQDSRRYYPKSASLAPLLGRINRDKKGVSGIEGEFENSLAGRNGVTQLSFNQNHQGSYFNPKTFKQLKHGEDIKLTIDADIQFYAYNALKKSVQKHQADSGSVIILAANGEILALANYPADDPNDKRIYNAQHYRNHALADKVEPGSTMKPFTMLLALDRRKIYATEDEKIDVTKRIGHIKPDGKYQQMTIKKILQKSHNLGTVNVAERLSKKALYETWKKLGFGQPLGLMPSIENPGTLRHFSHWSKADKHVLSFGHGPMEANLAQLARAYLVFANSGSVPNLKLIKNTYTDNEMTPVFSPKSTTKIAKLLDSVASQTGSGYRAQIKGYAVAGKTGTAEMVIDGTYNKTGAKRTFFTGFTPVESPKYIMAVRLDYPKKCYAAYNPKLRQKCQGSNSAAIVFKDAMQNILNFDTTISARHLN